MTGTITATALMAALNGNGEIALIDLREEASFGARHILLAANISLSHLEMRIADRVPRRAAPVVLCDAGEGLAEAAAERLSGFGYSAVQVLAGGIEAWAAAGYELFSGLNVPSKAFGEFVEHAYGTPSVSAEELQATMQSGARMVVLDSRPMAEFEVMNIPTGVDCPGAELVYRVQEIVPDPDTLVVVNCAGRTRSIIGAQSLINAGIPNPVVALRNGTMGWHLAGYQLEHGQQRPPPAVSATGAALARQRAELAAQRFGVRRIDAATLDAWRGEQAERTLFLLDVRTAEEFAAGHIADSRHAPGGQLVQGTDTHIATHKARVVLIDDAMTRALMTAGWLVQLGWPEVFVLESGLDGQEIATGTRAPAVLGLDAIDVTAVTPQAARDSQAGGAVVLDLQRSLAHRDKHIEGARFAIRANLMEDLKKLPQDSVIVLTSPDGILAKLAAPAVAATGRSVSTIAGGTQAWEAAGLPMAAGIGDPLSALDDAYLRAYDRTDKAEVERAMQDYLTWEIALVEQIARPGGIRFEVYPPPA